MRNGLLGDKELQDLVRQAVDLLYPPAQVLVEAFNPGIRPLEPRYGQMQAAQRRVVVRISPDNQCILNVHPEWTPTHALAYVIESLGTACGHRFRGDSFPACPGHDHAANVDEEADVVVLRCPDTGESVGRVRPTGA